jgi:hypothetical protein
MPPDSDHDYDHHGFELPCSIMDGWYWLVRERDSVSTREAGPVDIVSKCLLSMVC